jgi:pimeloyl-ACP methyl ester carboxylesterase
MSARNFLIALEALYTGQDAAETVAATTSAFTQADWAAAEVWRCEAWPGEAPIDLTALAAAGFPAATVVGSYDPALYPAAAKLAASEHLRALQAERHALARRLNARLLTFARSMHAPMIEEPDTFNALLRDTWRATRPGGGHTRKPAAGRPARWPPGRWPPARSGRCARRRTRPGDQ